jgi:hypothetical protein
VAGGRADVSELDKLAGRMGWTWIPQDAGDYNLGAFGRVPNPAAAGGSVGCAGVALMVLSPLFVLLGPFVLLPLWPVRVRSAVSAAPWCCG